MCKAKYISIKKLGIGGFSKVYEVRNIIDGKVYAMKVVKKSFIKDNSRIQQIISEKKIMEKLNHPFIVKLHSTFQTAHKIHFVMDLCPGGELFYHLHNIGKLNEKQAQFYMAEIILGMEYLHKSHIIYRDLKVQQLLA